MFPCAVIVAKTLKPQVWHATWAARLQPHIAIHDSLLNLTEILANEASVPQEHVTEGESLEETVLLHLVIEYLILALYWRPIVLVTLVPDATVSDGWSQFCLRICAQHLSTL